MTTSTQQPTAAERCAAARASFEENLASEIGPIPDGARARLYARLEDLVTEWVMEYPDNRCVFIEEGQDRYCGASLNDGEGFDGYCGNHADRLEAAGHWN